MCEKLTFSEEVLLFLLFVEIDWAIFAFSTFSFFATETSVFFGELESEVLVIFLIFFIAVFDNFLLEGDFNNFLRDILQTIREIRHVIFDTDLIGFAAVVINFEIIFGGLAELNVLSFGCEIILDVLSANIHALDAEFVVAVEWVLPFRFGDD